MNRGEFHAFNINRSALRAFLELANEVDGCGGHIIVSVDLIEDIGYVVVVRRRVKSAFHIERLRDLERAHGWGIES